MYWAVIVARVLLTVLCFFLVCAYRSHFASLFAVKPKIG